MEQDLLVAKSKTGDNCTRNRSFVIGDHVLIDEHHHGLLIESAARNGPNMGPCLGGSHQMCARTVP